MKEMPPNKYDDLTLRIMEPNLGQGPFHRKSILFNIYWMTFGFGLPISLYLCIMGILQIVTIVGISSGLESLRIAWYLLWPAGYYYYPISGEFYLHSVHERQRRVRALQTEFVSLHGVVVEK